MASKVSSTLGLSSASMAASDIEFLGIVLVGVAFAERAFLRLLFAAADIQWLGLERSGGRWRRRRCHRLRRHNPEERWRVRGHGGRRIAALHGSRHRVGVGAGINISAIRPRRFPFAALPQTMDAAATATSLECVLVEL